MIRHRHCRHEIAGCLALLVLGCSNFLRAEPLLFESAAAQTALLELFTSEGCSSCPPADEWLGRLKHNAALWRDVVPVAFHVDYWDGLGWSDRFADKRFTGRQWDYARAWLNGNSVYTPGFVLNGREWPAWRNHREFPRLAGPQVGVLRAASDNGEKWSVRFSPVADQRQRHEFYAALLGCDLDSEVTAGENRGRRLAHNFVALKLWKQTFSRHGENLSGEFVLNPPSREKTSARALAVWVTRAGELAPVQAVGGWLPR